MSCELSYLDEVKKIQLHNARGFLWYSEFVIKEEWVWIWKEAIFPGIFYP
jgi:hypothetical protein